MGSPIRLIDEQAKTQVQYKYDQFGAPHPWKKQDLNWPGPDNTYGYTGYQYDLVSGLYYAQARYYQPELGRFISEDPFKAYLAEPLTQNAYINCGNNPLLYFDPLGLFVVGVGADAVLVFGPGAELSLYWVYDGHGNAALVGMADIAGGISAGWSVNSFRFPTIDNSNFSSQFKSIVNRRLRLVNGKNYIN